jgi:hypothetical protein
MPAKTLLIFAAVVFFAGTGFAQAPTVLGNVSVVPGAGATLKVTLPFLNSSRLRFWTNGSSLPSGVTMTSTYVEPGSNLLALHFEAAGLAGLAVNRSVDIYASNSFVPAYQVILSVVAGTAPTCGSATVNPLDQSSQAVVAAGTTAGCNVEVWAGDSGGLEPLANATAGTGATLVRIPIPHRLTPGQFVRVLQQAKGSTTFLSAPFTVENNYVTSRYDSERSGWNPSETALTVNNVPNLKMICDKKVSGSVRAQPLYVQDVTIGGKTRNVVFVATDSDTNATGDSESSDLVYAFDADSCIANEKGLWVDGAGNPNPRSLIDSANGEQPVTATDLNNALQSVNTTLESPACAFLMGISATPVIDRTTNTLYVMALVENSGGMFYELHALDLATGKDQAGSPVKIDGTTVQFGGTSFTPALEASRPGLLLDRGVVYVGFGSRCDSGDFHGWVLGYDATLPGSANFLHQVGAFNTAPASGGLSSVWQAGLGLAADGSGTVYFATGNGTFDPTNGAYANTLLGLRLPTHAGSMNMEVTNFFTPFDWNSIYANDMDLSAGGPTLVSPYNPGPFTITGIPTHFILVGGKVAKSYLINRDLFDSGVTTGNPTLCNGGCQQDDTTLVQPILQAQGIVSAPAYYTGPQGMRVFYGLNFSPMAAFNFGALWSPLTAAETTADSAPETSPVPAVSSNGVSSGTGVLWAIFPSPVLVTPDPSAPEPLSLHAYDANNLQTNLLAGANGQVGLDAGTWESAIASNGNSFEVPTVIHGKVFTGSEDRVRVFAPVPHCTKIVVFGYILWLCPIVNGHRPFLQRRHGREWVTVRNQSFPLADGSVYLFDYAPTETATYRVCASDHPKDCEPEVTVHPGPKSKLERIPQKLRGKCGERGKPPCFLLRSWPVPPNEMGERRPPKER